MTSGVYYPGVSEEQFLTVFLGIFFGVILFSLALVVVMYVLQSIGLYTIAKRRGIKNPWLAWVPLGDYWIVGSISDDARLRNKGELNSRRWLVLGLLGGAQFVTFLQSLGTYYMMWTLWQNAQYMSAMEIEQSLMQMESSALSFGLLLDLAVSAASITGAVFYYMSLWDLYSSCRPRQKVVFLVLSIIFGLQPFFIFACRKCDYGMRPQRPQLPPQNPNWPQNPGWPPQNQWPSQNPGEPTQRPPQNDI